MKNSDIRITVTTDDGTVEGIHWQADEAAEAGVTGPQEAKAILLALWDAKARNAMRIDLWTHDMTIEDMNDFFFQTLLTLADSYRTATGNKELMAEIKIFARSFAEKAARAEARRTSG